MPTVWFALKRSFHCKTEASDVYEPNVRSNLSNIVTKKTARSGCSRSIENLKDVIHGSKRHLNKPTSCSPRSIGSSEFHNPIAHEVIFSNSKCELKITGYDCFHENGDGGVGVAGGGGGSSYVGALSPGAGGHHTVHYYNPSYKTSVNNNTGRKSHTSVAVSDKSSSKFGGSAIFGGGGGFGSSNPKVSHGADSNGSSMVTCHKCGEQFGKWEAVEAHHLSKHAVIMSSHGSNAAASQSTSPSTCTPSTTTRRKPSKDIGWEYGTADPSVAGRVVCNLCKKVLNGGIRRLKEHLIGGLGNCTGCPGASIEIQKKVKEFMVSKKEQAISKKKIQMAINMRDDVFEIDDDDVDPKKDDEPMILGSTGGSAILSGSGGGGVSNLRKRDARTFLKTNVKGPLDTLLMPDPSKKMKQKCLDDDNPHKQKLRDVACEKIAIWSYEAGVAFNAFRLSSFQTMVNAIGYYGKDMPAPTYHEMRTTLLKVVYEKQKAFVDSFRGYWATYGCSIMADWWTDGKQRTLINFLVNCPQGTVFLKSIDGSDFKKDHTLIVDYINEVIKEVGEENIVQFITDNASNFKTAGAVLEGQHPTMFWTPCAAHCVNLMLQDIAKSSSKIKNVLVEARAIVVYIYNHGRVLNLMRQFTNGELHRSAVTRFATSFYTLQSLHKNKQALRKMFVCDKWVKSDFAKKLDGKHVQNIIARGAFWDNVLYACRIMAPLVDIIRLVDTEEKPCMGYIYEGLDRAKEQIEKNLGESLRRTTNKIWAIIDKRWETQLHHPLHAAGFYLNPAIYYKHTTLAIEGNAEIKRGLRKAISKLVPNEDENDRVFDQLADFREVKGDFGDPRAIRRRETLQPYEWWMQFGASTPDLQKFALKVLGQTCSASPCERNWSTFDHLHSKKRNCLLQKKLNDLVFIQYNMKLKRRFDERMATVGSNMDPIILKEVDENDEWIIPTDEELQEFVHAGDDLTWAQVEDVMGHDGGGPTTRNRARRGYSILDDDEDAELEEPPADDDHSMFSEEEEEPHEGDGLGHDEDDLVVLDDEQDDA